MFKNTILTNIIHQHQCTLTPENVDAISNQLKKLLDKCNVSNEHSIELILSTENTLINWLEANMIDYPVKYTLYRMFGKYYLQIKLVGDEHNPLLDTTLNGLPIEYASNLQSLLGEQNVSSDFLYENGENVVTLALPRKHLSPIMLTMISVLLSFTTYGIFTFLPAELMSFISEQIIIPLNKTIIDTIKAMSMLMIFTAMITSIHNMGDIKTFINYGRSTLLHIQVCNSVGVLCTIPFLFILPNINISGASLDFHALSSIFELVFDIIPENIFSPFIEPNPLQIIFMGIVFGCFFLTVQEKTAVLYTNIQQLHLVFNSILLIACKAIPLVVYLCLTQLLISNAASKLFLMINVFVLIIAFSIMAVLLRLLYVSKVTNISFKKMLFDFKSCFFTGLTTASSITVMPILNKVLQSKYKVKTSFLEFAIPLEIITLRPIIGAAYFISTILIADSYGIEITIGQLITGGLFAGLIATSAPPTPGMGFILISLDFNYFSLPNEALALPLTVDIFFDMIITAFSTYFHASEFLILNHKLSKV